MSALSREIIEQSAPFRDDVSSKGREVESSAQKAVELKTKSEAIQAEIKELKARVESYYSLQANMKERIVSAGAKRQTLKEWEQKNPIRSTINALKEQHFEGIRGPLSSLVHITAGMEDIVASALGEKLDFMVADTLLAAQKAITFLQEKNLGRLTFIIIEKIPSRGPLSFLGQSSHSVLSLIRTERSLENLLNYLCKSTILEGNTVYGEAIVQGGGKMAADKHIFIDEQYKKLEADLRDDASELSRLDGENKAVTERLSTLEKQSSDIYGEYEKANLQSELMKQQLTELRSRISSFENDISSKNQLIKAKEEEKDQLLIKIRLIEEDLNISSKEEEKLRHDLKITDNEIKGLRENEIKVRQQLNDVKVELTKVKSDFEARQREESKAKDTVQSILSQIGSDKKELESANIRIIESKNIQTEEAQIIKGLQKKSSAKETEVQAVLLERQNLISNIEKKTEETHRIRQESEELKKEIHDLELDKRSYELQIQNFEKTLSENYETKLEVSIEEKYKDFVIDEAEIIRLRKRIESLGNVNLAAPEEYASLQERYNFLLAQQQDLA